MPPKKAAAASAASSKPSRAGTKRKAEEPVAPTVAKKAKATTRAVKTPTTAATKETAPAKKATTKKAAAPKQTKSAASRKPAAATKTQSTAAAIKKSASPAEKKQPASRRRKAETEVTSTQPTKKVKPLEKGPVINEPPTAALNVYVFGEGSSGELGLGTAKNGIDVKRPRLNANLAADKAGVVKIVAGGMHCLALTQDNKILSWGVNDQGALGRDTTWEGGLRDMDAEEDSDSESGDDNGINPKECTPEAVDFSQTELAEGMRFADIAAGDSCSFAVTDDGRVYGWGTFRKGDGIFGFTSPGNVVTRPVLLPDLKKITSIATGSNHALALDSTGAVWAWGAGEQMQLGRRIIARTQAEGLIPRQFGLPKGPKNGISQIASGSDHSFAISKNGAVYSWGSNNFGETGVADGAGEDNAAVTNPTIVASLNGKVITTIAAGTHHTIAATEAGECLVWGRVDSAQSGIEMDDIAKLPDDAIIRDPNKGEPRIIILPQPVAEIEGDVSAVAAAGDQCIAVTKEGKAWSWGFSSNYQTGQGTDEDVEVATLMDNTAIRGKKITGAECGGQFGMLTERVLLANGV
ncbi:uncharacterized protein LTR77_005442 [Saxophila tyrrhenica]|uniref:RCC1-like domain-containing protein n=1 Tax=Saxophila tyrrhenica TaxID=1690608 RepID=A0AAV9P8T4_9PEZI|nr:hypothetical protein LTR77_005442 [Saxophila tyrrhenica]